MTIKSITVKDGQLVTVKEENPTELVLNAIGTVIAVTIAVRRIPQSKHPRWLIAGIVAQVGLAITKNVLIVKKFVDAA